MSTRRAILESPPRKGAREQCLM